MKIKESSQCIDPSYSKTQGLVLYAKTIDFNPGTGVFQLPSGGLRFNDGTTDPPRQSAESCPGKGSVYDVALRACFECP
eukprot:6034190-Heterocapsa_arctica.AAC.1